MNSKRRPVRKHILISLTLILVLLFVTPGVAPAQERAGVDQSGAATAALSGLTDGEQATILDLIREAEYQFAWQVGDDGEWAYRAPNRAHGLSLSLAVDGFHAARYREGERLWEFGLSLAAYGQQAFSAAIAEGDLVGSREQVEYHWSPDVVEWYANSADGVEHGLTLAAPPAGEDGGPVELTFALRGSLAPTLAGDGRALHLKDTNSETVLRYDQLAVYDATGRVLPSHMRLSKDPQSAHLHLVIDTAGALYPLTVDPVLHGQAAKLTASDTEDEDEFGFSVAVSGDIVVVGAPYEDGTFMDSDRGAAYLFERNKLGTDYWGEVRKLDIMDPTGGAHFGFSVAVSGNTVVVGAPKKDYVGGSGCATGPECGAAYIFERNLGGPDYWGMLTKIHADDADDYDRFGWSVAIHNDTIIVGAPYADGIGQDSGAAYVFERNQGGADAWGQVELLTPATVGALQFGHSVGISDDTVVVGAWQTVWGGGSGRGAAHIFYRNKLGADSWGAVATLTASDGEDEDQFGNAVAISGDTVVVGAYSEDGAGTDRGAAYVFERNQGGVDAWDQVTKLTALDAANLDYFGDSVAISGDTIVIGAWGEQGAGTDRGAAYVFERNRGGADAWGRARKLAASDAQDNDSFGNAVAISGDTIVAGAPWEDGANPNSSRGAAYLFVYSGGSWQEVANLRADDAGDDDRFGFSVGISGDTAVVGADGEDGGGDDMGAAYVLERNQDGADSWGQVKKLFGWDSTNHDWFGISVAISGDTVVVGAYGKDDVGSMSGAAYVFERNYDRVNPGIPKADNWGQVAKLTASDAGDGDRFGYSVAISDDTIAVGAPWEQGSAGYDRGSAYIFTRNKEGADNWGQAKKLLASDEQDYAYFGYAVAISGDTVVVGAFRDGVSDSERGAAYVFERNEGGTADNWGEVTKLTASDAANGDRFGSSVAISGDTIVVGAYWENGWMMDDRGAAYVFERNKGGAADNWGQVDKLLASDMAAGDEFGQSVGISVDTVVVGAHREDAGVYLPNRGAAYVYERNQGGSDDWGQVTKLLASGGATNDYFGHSVAISDDTIIVGAYGKNGAPLSPDHGAAYVFSPQPYRIYLPLTRNN